MIGTIRRHQKWLWGFIIAATILSFTVYLSPTSKYGGGPGTSAPSSAPNLGSIDGEPITPVELNAAVKEAALYYFFRSGVWPAYETQKNQLVQLAHQSLMLRALMAQYKVNPTTDAAARFAKQIFRVPPDQAFPLDEFNKWAQNELGRKGGLSVDDFNRFARDQAGQECLISLFGMSGQLITSKEAEFFYRRENQPMATEIASFPITNYYGAPPTESELQDYFTKHEADYRLPDRVQINYITFDPTNYAGQIDKILGTNIDDKVDAYYHQQGAEAFKDESGQTLTAAAAQARIKQQMRQMTGLQEARKDANAFLVALAEGHDDSHPYAASDLEKLAKSKGLIVKTSEPFDEKKGSKEIDLPPRAMRLLFALREDAPDDPGKSMLYVSSPLVGEKGVYVAGLARRLPSQVQNLAAVRDQVTKDYRESKALALAADAGEKFAGAVQVGLTQGKSFDAVCAAQNIKPRSLPPFALTTTNLPPGFDKASFQELQETAFPVPTGECSKYTPVTDGGLVVYVKERLPVDEARMAQELPFYLTRMREQRQIAAFSAWLNHQFQLRFIPPPSEPGNAG